VPKWRQCRKSLRRRTTPWLEDPDVENIMYPCTIRQLEAIGHSTDPVQHLVWPSEARTQLGAPARHQRLCWPMEQPEKDPIAHSELQRAMTTIIVALGILLSLEKTLTHILQKRIPVMKKSVDRVRRCRAFCVR
jgi:hypothetical protein